MPVSWGTYRDDSGYLSRIEIRQNANYPNTLSDLKAMIHNPNLRETMKSSSP